MKGQDILGLLRKIEEEKHVTVVDVTENNVLLLFWDDSQMVVEIKYDGGAHPKDKNTF